jgi:polyhydroxyalkanoate synthesis regulator phasin
MTIFSRSLRRGLLALSAVAVLGGAAVGIAAAQAAPATPAAGQAQSGYQKFLDALAKRLNTSTAALQTAIDQARTDTGLPAGGRGFPGPGGKGGPGRAGFGGELNAAATAIGITPQQLHTELAGKSLAQVAQAHGKTAADVATALKNAAHARIDQAVTAGRLTADQATTQKTQVDQRIDQLVNQVMPQPGAAGRGRPGGPGGFGGRGGFGADLNAAATAIGIDARQLRTELNGKSLAEVAQAHGKTAADVATALKNAAHTRIDQAVTAGRLTADQATTQKTQVDQRIDQLVNQVTQQRTRTGTTGADIEIDG